MTLEELNTLPPGALREVLGRCNGSIAWVEGMLGIFPVKDKPRLMDAAAQIWQGCSPADWREAFAHHPRIGDIDALREKFASTRQWASGEQSGVEEATDEVLAALAEGNRVYEARFGYIFIICATGRTAAEMLALLQTRLSNDPAAEIRIAMGEQQKITDIRLEKLLS